MRNEILKILWFSVFICGDAFSMNHDICIENHLKEKVILTRNAIRRIEVIEDSKTVDFQEELSIKNGEKKSLRVDARPYYPGQREDSIKINVGENSINCSFVTLEGNVYVYPFLKKDSKIRFRFIKKRGGGSRYTLIIGPDRQA